MQQIEHNTQQRIDAILAPLFGAGNAHSQVSADIDFSKLEQTAESYGPNAQPAEHGDPQPAIERVEMTQGGARRWRAGRAVEPAAGRGVGAYRCSRERRRAAAKPRRSAMRKDTTTNYEVDRTVRHYEQPMGGIKRLSVAVVVNYQKQGRRQGPRDDAAAARRQARAGAATGEGRDGLRRKAWRLGERGQQHRSWSDSTVIPDVPWWRTPDMIARAMQIAKYAGIGAVALFLYFSMVKPALRRAFPPPPDAVSARRAGRARRCSTVRPCRSRR